LNEIEYNNVKVNQFKTSYLDN